MPDLIAPHGGLTEPQCCTVPDSDIDQFKLEAADLAKVPVSAADLSSVYRFGDGTLSPLTGPMNGEVYHRVLDEGTVENNGVSYAWTIPISFPVTSQQAESLSAGQRVALTGPDGQVVGTLDVNDVFQWDKQHYLLSVYQTERTDHPGGDMVLTGDADQTASDWRRHPRATSTYKRQLWAICIDSESGPRGVGRQGLGFGCCLSDSQPSASSARVRAGLRLGETAARRSQRGAPF